MIGSYITKAVSCSVCAHSDISLTRKEEGTDHLQIVYGWTRQVIIYAARVSLIESVLTFSVKADSLSR